MKKYIWLLVVDERNIDNTFYFSKKLSNHQLKKFLKRIDYEVDDVYDKCEWIKEYLEN